MRKLKSLPGLFRKAWLLIWKRVTGKRNHIQIGNREIEVKPLRAKATLQVLLLIVPYLRDVLPSLMATKDLMEPGLFRETMRGMMRSMAESFPMDVVKLCAIFLDVSEEWLEEEFYPEEMIKAFEVATRVNRLDDIMRVGLSIGIISFGDLSWLNVNQY